MDLTDLCKGAVRGKVKPELQSIFLLPHFEIRLVTKHYSNHLVTVKVSPVISSHGQGKIVFKTAYIRIN